MTLDDLTVSLRELDRNKLLEDWLWLTGPNKLPILLTRIGNVFVQDTKANTIHLLNVGSGELLHIADTPQIFEEVLSNRSFVMSMFAVKTIVSLEKSGVCLKPREVYSFKLPPILGGHYDEINLVPTDVFVHFSLLGQICCQAVGSGDGASITNFSVTTES